MAIIQRKSIRRAIRSAIGTVRKIKNAITPTNAKKASMVITKKVVAAKKKVKTISKKELSRAHVTVRKELGKAKIHLMNAEHKVILTVKNNPKKAIFFATRIAKAIGQGVLAGLKESPKKPAKKRKTSRSKKATKK